MQVALAVLFVLSLVHVINKKRGEAYKEEIEEIKKEVAKIEGEIQGEIEELKNLTKKSDNIKEQIKKLKSIKKELKKLKSDIDLFTTEKGAEYFFDKIEQVSSFWNGVGKAVPRASEFEVFANTVLLERGCNIKITEFREKIQETQKNLDLLEASIVLSRLEEPENIGYSYIPAWVTKKDFTKDKESITYGMEKIKEHFDVTTNMISISNEINSLKSEREIKSNVKDVFEIDDKYLANKIQGELKEIDIKIKNLEEEKEGLVGQQNQSFTFYEKAKEDIQKIKIRFKEK